METSAVVEASTGAQHTVGLATEHAEVEAEAWCAERSRSAEEDWVESHKGVEEGRADKAEGTG